MEKRIGTVTILVENRDTIREINSILSSFSDIIMGRMGIPVRDRGIFIISLIVDGTTDQIGAMTGRAGRLPGVQVKSALTGFREKRNANNDSNIT